MDAQLMGAPVLDTLNPVVGTADLSLNAAQQQYIVSNTNFTTPSVAMGNGISFTGWFYPTGPQSPGSTIFDISGTGCAVSLYYGPGGQTMYGYFNGGVVRSTVVVTPGTWHFFCYTIYCTAVGTALQSLYIDARLNTDGAYAATNTTTNYVSFSGGGEGTGAYLGYGVSTGGTAPVYGYFNGKIDDFRFYNRVLSLPEINVFYTFNYKSGTTPTIVSQMAYDLSYVNAVQIDVSGTFSGLYVTRTAQVGTTTSVTASSISCANLVFVNASTWAYVDTTVAADTSYSYTIQPFVLNTAGAVVNFGSITTTPLYNGFFNQGSSLPIYGQASVVTVANLSGWTVTGTGTGQASLCNGPVTGFYTGSLPSTVTYYVDISQNVASTTSLSQYAGIYQGTSGMVSFYAWPKDLSYNTTETITVMLGGIILLNRYSFPAVVPGTTGTPPTAFNLPFTMTTAGTYQLTITVANTGTGQSGINLGGVQIRSAVSAGVGYKIVDPSGLALYYPFDLTTVVGTTVYDCSAGFADLVGVTGVGAFADASLCGGAQQDTTQAIMGGADVYLNGTSAYVQIGAWTMPPAVAGNGFTISGWFRPSVTVEPSNATLCFFGSTAGNLFVYLNQQNNLLDFSYNMAGGSEYVTSAYGVQANQWNFYAMTAYYNGTKGVFTYYLNDVSMATQMGVWPATTATFTNNYLGGVPFNNPNVNSYGTLGYFAGYMDDFRVYNRALSVQDILSLWNYGFASNQYANVIDMSGLGMYYPFDQGSTLARAPPSAIYGFTATVVTSSGFILAWQGGTGMGVSYTYTVNGATVVPSSGTVSPVTLTGLTAPTSGSTPTPNVWTVVVTATNSAGTTTGTGVVYLPPTVSGVWNGAATNTLTLTVTNYVVSGLTYTYTLTGTGMTTQTGVVGVGGTATSGTLTGIGPWTVTVTAVGATGTLTGTTLVYTNAFTITPNITGWNSATDVSGPSVSNGIPYQVYAFKQTGVTYTLSYNSNQASYIYVLAVGGGGAGTCSAGAGGGGGGVVMNPVYLPVATSTINVNVGAGGSGNTVANNVSGATAGGTTTVSFGGTPLIYAYGGGMGEKGAGAGGPGGSSGGSYASTNYTPPNNNYNNFANPGLLINYSSFWTGGGGGAGTASATGSTVESAVIRAGGNGIQCFLPGINNFAPAGVAYGTYYWGGGGGGSTNNSYYYGGNGGLGGGGGGTTQGSPNNGGLGGGSALNPGGNGGNNDNKAPLYGPAGNGGANTGGGGGGTWNGLSGAGGSGIVVIAFPQRAITNNATAVLPTALYTSGLYNDVLSNTTLSTVASRSMKGAFSCRLVNYNYFGPVMTLRYSTDTDCNYTQNFYADVCGNLGTGYLGTGTSVSAWLTANGANTTYAYVTKWYNQSMDICFNCAFQYTLNRQPIYDVSYGVINFGYRGTGGGVVAPNLYANLSLPNGAYPYGDASYSFTFKLWNYTNGGIIYGGGDGGVLSGCNIVSVGTTSLSNTWQTNDYNISGITWNPNTYATLKYVYGTSGTRTDYINGALVNGTYVSKGIRKQTATFNYIMAYGNTGSNGTAGYGNSQLYYFYFFGSSLEDADRLIVEATPYDYTTPVALTVTVLYVNITSFTLSTSNVSGAAYFVVFVNNSVAYTSTGALTAVTVTPASTPPWFVNVVAYDTNYRVIATGTTTASATAPTPLFVTSLYNAANSTVTIAWTGGTGTAVSYTYTSSSSGSATTGPTAITSGATVAATGNGPWTFTITATNGVGSTSMNTSTNCGVQSFTTINSSSTASVLSSASLPAAIVNGGHVSIAVDLLQAKMLIIASGIAYWATSTDGGTTWSSFSSKTLTSGQGSNIRNGCAFRNDGQFGYAQTGSACYTVNWTGANPTFIQFDTTVATLCQTKNYFGACMTPDGKTLFVVPFESNLYYTRFNTTTNTYPAFTAASFAISRMGVATNATASMVFTSENGNDTSRTITWNGDVATFSASSVSNVHIDDRAYTLIGGNYTGTVQPYYMLAIFNNLTVYPWNPTTKQMNTSVTTVNGPSLGTVETFQITMGCGTQGNIFYYMYNSNTVYKLILNVT